MFLYGCGSCANPPVSAFKFADGLAQNSFLFRMYKQMPSVGTVIAQRKSKKLVNTQNEGQSGENGPYFFPQGGFDTWYANNSDDVTKVSPTLYLVKAGADFANIAGDIPYDSNIDNRRTFTDMGKTLYLGDSTDSALIVFQLVQVPGLTANGGLSGAVGYIVVENNCKDTPSADWGRLTPRVARA